MCLNLGRMTESITVIILTKTFRNWHNIENHSINYLQNFDIKIMMSEQVTRRAISWPLLMPPQLLNVDKRCRTHEGGSYLSPSVIAVSLLGKRNWCVFIKTR